MAYPPTSPEGGPSFASEFDILEGIACQVQAMNVAAGGASYPINASSFFGLLQSIDCNLCSTVDALGGATCVGGFDGEMGLLMSIACNSRSLVTALSGTNEGNGYEYNTPILWNQINCNFRGGAVATGTAAPGGYSGDSVWNLLESIYCAVAQIVDNGFAPPDPVQALIDAINAFSPDILLIGDRGTSTTVNGAPVSPWADQSGNGNNAVVGTGATTRPTYSAAGFLGKNALSFDGVDNELESPFVNSTNAATVMVVFNVSSGTQASSRLITTAQATNSGDTNGDVDPIFSYVGAGPSLNTYPSGSVKTFAEDSAQIASVLFSGGNANITVNGVAGTPAAVGGAMGVTLLCLGAQATSGQAMTGKIAAVVAWKTAQSAPNIASITTLLRTYYGF